MSMLKVDLELVKNYNVPEPVHVVPARHALHQRDSPGRVH